jgi:hypothetical protein
MQSRVVATRPGYVNVYVFQDAPDLFSLCQYWDYRGCCLPSPRIDFRFDQGRATVKVISWEGFFNHDGSEPVREFQTMEDPDEPGDSELQEELAQRLLETLVALDGHRVSAV